MWEKMNLIVKQVVALGLLFISFFFSFSPQTFALDLDLGFDALIFRPASDGGTYIGIWGSENRNRSEWNLGTLSTYAYHPLQLTTNGNRSRGVLDHTLIQHFYGQYGLINQWLSVGLDLPVGWADFRDPDASSTDSHRKGVVGDISVNFKSTLVQSPRFGLALRPFVTVPTGYGKKFFGNGNFTGGGTLIAEVKPSQIWSLALNAGLQARESYKFKTISKDSQLALGAGTALQITRSIKAVAEIESMTRLKQPFRAKGSSPTEARGALQWKIGQSGFTATAGGTGGIVIGSGSPAYGAFAGILFVPPERGGNKQATKRFRTDLEDYTIYFDVDSDVIADSENAQKLVRLADQIRGLNRKTKITGHAAGSGDRLYNIGLAKKRAEKTALWLQLLGISASDLIVDFRVEGGSTSNNQRVSFSWE